MPDGILTSVWGENPQSTQTLGIPSSQVESRTRSTAGEIIGSIGNIILGGIALFRIPKERIPTPTAPAPVEQPSAQPVQGFWTTRNTVLVSLLVVLVGLLIWRMAR